MGPRIPDAPGLLRAVALRFKRAIAPRDVGRRARAKLPLVKPPASPFIAAITGPAPIRRARGASIKTRKNGAATPSASVEPAQPVTGPVAVCAPRSGAAGVVRNLGFPRPEVQMPQ